MVCPHREGPLEGTGRPVGKLGVGRQTCTGVLLKHFHAGFRTGLFTHQKRGKHCKGE